MIEAVFRRVVRPAVALGLAAFASALAHPPAAAAATAYKAGTFQLKQTYAADLDDGTITSAPGADLQFEAATATSRYLRPLNGAAIAFPVTVPAGGDGLAVCESATYVTVRVSASSQAALYGKSFCVKTGAGRFALVKVAQAESEGTYDTPQTYFLDLTFTTWDASPPDRHLPGLPGSLATAEPLQHRGR